MKNNPNWLSELDGTVPEAAYGISINVYAIAYEAWRRGLNISFENVYSKSRGRHFTRYHIYNRKKSFKFSHNRSELVSQKAVKRTSNNLETRNSLAIKGIPIIKSEIIKNRNIEEIEKKTKELDYPVKITSLRTPFESKKYNIAVNAGEILKIIEKENEKSNEFLVEESVCDERWHAYIVGEKVIGIYKKVAPHITGDGRKSIRELLKETNIIRNMIPSIKKLEVRLNKRVRNELKKQKYSPDSVPEAGKIVWLKAIEDVMGNGDAIDVTEAVSNEMKSNLVRATKSIPDLIQSEVEFLYDLDSMDYRIISINAKAGIMNYLYPLKGSARSVPKAIIDYHFPETEGKYLSDTTPKYYFDYEIVNNQLQNNRLSKIVIPRHRYEPNLVSKSISFESNLEVKKLEKTIRNHFIKLKFDGEFKALGNNQFRLIIAGNYQDVAYFIDYLHSKNHFKNVKYSDYDYGVRIGYTFKDLRSHVSQAKVDKIQNEKNMEKFMGNNNEIQLKDEKIFELEQEIKALKNSKSWKITEPARRVRRRFGK